MLLTPPRAFQTALNKLIEASRRVQHDKHAWSKAASVAARAAALDSEKLTRRAEKAEKEAEDLRAQVAALKSSLEAEKLRSSKQQALSSSAVQAANKRAAQFEQLYEHAKATAMEERHKVESFRVAATELNRQLEFGGPGGAIPLNLLLSSTATDAGIRAARRSMGTAAGAGAATTPVRATTAAGNTPGASAGKRASVSRGAGTPSPSGARAHAPAGSPSVSSTSKVTTNLASKAAAGVKSTASSGAGKAGHVTAPLSALLHTAASPRTSAVSAGQEAAPVAPAVAPEAASA